VDPKDLENRVMLPNEKKGEVSILNFADYRWMLQAHGMIAGFYNTLSSHLNIAGTYERRPITSL